MKQLSPVCDFKYTKQKSIHSYGNDKQTKHGKMIPELYTRTDLQPHQYGAACPAQKRRKNDPQITYYDLFS